MNSLWLFDLHMVWWGLLGEILQQIIENKNNLAIKFFLVIDCFYIDLSNKLLSLTVFN